MMRIKITKIRKGKWMDFIHEPPPIERLYRVELRSMEDGKIKYGYLRWYHVGMTLWGWDFIDHTVAPFKWYNDINN